MAKSTASTKTPAVTARAAGEKNQFLERLMQGLHRGRYVFWTVFGLLIALLVGYLAFLEINKNRSEQAAILAEEAGAQYEEWQTEQAADRKSTLETALSEKLDLIMRKYPRQYATQRARMIRATLLTKQEKWELASQEYLGLVEKFPRSYLAPVALFGAAVCMEDAKNETGAIDAYGRLITGYPSSYLVTHALFSRGRLYEATAELDKAKVDYTALSDGYPSSGWTRLAKNRILALELKGR